MIKKIFLLNFLALTVNTYSQCAETNQDKVMLIGDSWASFMNIDQTIDDVFDDWGHSNYSYYSNTVLAENGAETIDFLGASKKSEIQTQLTNRPSIKFVHLSLGGNDVLGSWNKSFSVAKTDSLIDSVIVRLQRICTFIKNIRPDIKIVYSGYVYTNFEEVIQAAAPFQSSHPFYGQWQSMGFPTATEINAVLNKFTNDFNIAIAGDPRMTFVNAQSLMQYVYGQTGALGVAPFGTFPANTATIPLGFANYPSNKSTMRNYSLFKDCFHLSPQAYRDFISYHTQKYYHKALMDSQYFLSEGGTRDGAVSSLGNTSNVITIGESSGEKFAAVLSFNTMSMPDSSVQKASIFLRRDSLRNTNPITSPLQVKVKQGKFSATVNVEASDYTALASATGTACIFGSYANNKDWVRIDLPTSILPFIKKDSLTQFIISAPSAVGGKVFYHGASDPDFAPVLNLKYAITTGVNSIAKKEMHAITVFPNPASDRLEIQISNEYKANSEIIITNALGQVIQTIDVPSSSSKAHLDIKDYAIGTYFITLKNEKINCTDKFVKITN